MNSLLSKVFSTTYPVQIMYGALNILLAELDS
jgi:hypothetical protein